MWMDGIGLGNLRFQKKKKLKKSMVFYGCSSMTNSSPINFEHTEALPPWDYDVGQDFRSSKLIMEALFS